MRKYTYLFCCILIILSFWFIGRPKAKIYAIPPNYSLYLDECCDEDCMYDKCEGVYDFADKNCDIAISLSTDEICSNSEQRDCLISSRYGVLGCSLECDGEEITYVCDDHFISEEDECRLFGSRINIACEVPAKFREEDEDGEAGFCG